MPDTTRADAESGRVGLTVVFARWKEVTPAIAMAKPSRLRAAATGCLAGKSTLKRAATRAVSHMRSAALAQIRGGGIFNSRLVSCNAAVKLEPLSRLAKNPAATMS